MHYKAELVEIILYNGRNREKSNCYQNTEQMNNLIVHQKLVRILGAPIIFSSKKLCLIIINKSVKGIYRTPAMMNHDCVGNVRVSMDSGIIKQD